MDLIRSFAAAGIAGAALAAAAAQDGSFSQAVKPEDFAAAGLSKLSPDELSRLDRLVQDYRSGALESARREALAASAARAAAETRARDAEAEAKTAREAQAAAAVKSKSLLERARAVVTPGAKVEYEPIASHITGDVNGWDAHTTFTLENGQRWQVADYSHYFRGKAVRSPSVEIRPAGIFGGFDMWIEGFPAVRVRLMGEGLLHPGPSAVK